MQQVGSMQAGRHMKQQKYSCMQNTTLLEALQLCVYVKRRVLWNAVAVGLPGVQVRHVLLTRVE
jgi:hypothetical protein